jgi:hypothetical protein
MPNYLVQTGFCDWARLERTVLSAIRLVSVNTILGVHSKSEAEG